MGIEYYRNRKARRKFKLLNILRLIGGILFVILIFEVILLFISSISFKPVIAKWGLIEKGYWTEALFLRKEKILTAPADGYLTTRVEPGVRVKKGELLAFVSADRSSLSSDAMDQNINRQMRILNLNHEKQDLNGDLQRIEAEIRYKYNDPNKSSPKIREDIDLLEKERVKTLIRIKEIELAINDLKEATANEPDQLSIITAPQPGYVFFQFDDWEERIVPENFFNITEPDLLRNYVLRSPANQVKAGEKIGKVIDPFKQLIVVRLSPQLNVKPNLNESWWLKTSEGDFKVNILNLISLLNGKTLLVLEDTTINHTFLPNRRSKVFLVFKRIEGICIPVKALHRNGHVTRVKVLDRNGYRLKEVQVMETDGIKAIVKGIEFGKIIISR